MSQPNIKTAASNTSQKKDELDSVRDEGEEEASDQPPVLYYFNGRGRAEIIRLIMKYNKMEFVDNRISKDEWLEMKPKSEFGELPIFTWGSLSLCQSQAIARYLATKLGMAGDNEEERARIDMVVECAEHVIKTVLDIYFENDLIKKDKMKGKFENIQLPIYIGYLEKMLDQGGTEKKKFFVGEKISWADLTVMNLKDYLAYIDIDIPFVKHPTLYNFISDIAAIPQVDEWLKERPETEL